MIESVARLVSRGLSVLVRSQLHARVTRGVLVVLAVVFGLVMLAWEPPSGTCQVMTALQVAVVLLLCRWPGSMLLVGLPVPLLAWCLVAHPGWPRVALFTLLLWLVRRLCGLASLAPAHSRMEAAVVRMAARDALLELGLLVVAGVLVAAGVLLARSLPGGPWWAVGLLAVAVGAVLALDDGHHV